MGDGRTAKTGKQARRSPVQHRRKRRSGRSGVANEAKLAVGTPKDRRANCEPWSYAKMGNALRDPRAMHVHHAGVTHCLKTRCVLCGRPTDGALGCSPRVHGCPTSQSHPNRATRMLPDLVFLPSFRTISAALGCGRPDFGL